MQLKFDKAIRKKVITIELETTRFTTAEERALVKFGEPIIKIEKMYGTFPVSIERRIKTGFKVRVQFDGTDNFPSAVQAANEFFEEVQEELRDTMEALMIKLEDTEYVFEAKKGIIDLTTW